ncbi:hypothetical protein [Apibacter sp. HY039]|uniref:hypothetical protein n=1 Tax=Apibacter sp. HY039 TaxID=2501476 RepID=UPI001C8751FC|nr:hypothetical protein [Apibacter sp. HY039]
MDLENKENAYYHMPVLTSPNYKGEKYIAPLTFAPACIMKKRELFSTISKNCMKDMNIPVEE